MLRSFWGAFTAELQLLSGEQLAAFNWVESAPSYPLMPITNVSDPNLALLRINLAQNTTSSLQRADKMISELEPILSKTNNGHFLYGIHIAKALLLFLQSEEEQSILVLNRANQRFGPGGMLTVIVEFGPAVIPLLEQYLQTYPEDSMSSDVLGLLKPGHSPADKYKLTNREIVIIKLLSQNLTNKEIASRLFISEKTVKRHSSNLYKKLQVKNRREAARQAEAMELF
jgi:DNA-binding CsgD family transcriptional regulator